MTFGNKWEMQIGDCRLVLDYYPADSIDTCVTDPPYHLSGPGTKTGFMGQQWDGGDVAAQPDTWRAVFRVLKPGAHLVSFGGTRTYHRMACAIEDAGFEIRDQLAWVYGQGFPKSLDVSKKIADAEAAKRWEGWGTNLKPAWEPICLARKPLVGTVANNVQEYGVGALNINGCRVESAGSKQRVGGPSQERRYTEQGVTNFAAKPGPRGGDPLGRWPANLVHDGGDEVLSYFPDAPGQIASASRTAPSPMTSRVYGKMDRNGARPAEARGDSGSAARFFYCAKATKIDRAGSDHPTVKPQALMRWLCRLVTPPGGVVLDPFAGSGSTGQAALAEGFSTVLIEQSKQYAADIERRMRGKDGAS